MRDEELDRILSEDAGIVPSSGFAGAVMDAVRRDAATPPPIPFPWRRAVPGLAACVLALAWVALGPQGERSASASSTVTATVASTFSRALETGRMVGAGWITLALFLAWASVKLSMRLTGGRG